MRTPTRVALTLLVSGICGCIDNGITTREFEGYSQSGSHFRIWKSYKWFYHWKTTPYLEQLGISWSSSSESHEGTTRSGAILVERDAADKLGFNVRTNNNRIWLLDSSNIAFAAVDFDSPMIYPNGSAQPSWATSTGGTLVENLAPLEYELKFTPFKAPDFTLEKLTGGSFMLSSQRGKVVILNFFGAGCGPCLLESPHLVVLQRKYEEAGLVVVSINAWNDWKMSVKKFAKKGALGDHVLVLLKGKSVAKQFDVTGVPMTFWISRDGTAIDATWGFDEDSAADLEARTRKALGLDTTS